MLTALLLLVIAIAVLVVILLAVVVAGIHREPSAELSSRAPSLMAGLARRMAGVYVRRPDPSADADTRDTCLAGHVPGQGEEGEPR